MTTELAKRSTVQPSDLMQLRTVADLQTMGQMMAKSGFFASSREAAQAMVQIQCGQELGIPPFAAMSGIHVINGKLCISAGTIAAMIKRSGKYDYKVITWTNEACSVRFFERGEVCGPDSTFTLPDAATAGLLNNQTWKKFPRNMLFARCITNGARMYCAEIFLGPIYEPSEMGATVGEDGEILSLPAAAVEAEPVAPPASTYTRADLAALVSHWSGVPASDADSFFSAFQQIAKGAGVPVAKGGRLADEQLETICKWAAATMRTGLTWCEYTTAKPAPAAPVSGGLVKITGVTRVGKRHRIDADAGEFYTFSSTVAKQATLAIGALCRVNFTDGEHGRTVTELVQVDPPATAGDHEQDVFATIGGAK